MSDLRTPPPRWPIHPLLLGLYPVLFLWGINASAVPWREGLMLCAVAAIVALVAQALATAFTHERRSGAILASLIVLVTFMYGRLYAATVGLSLGGVVIGRHRVLLTVVTLLVVLSARGLRRPRPWYAAATGALNAAAILLLVMAAVPMLRPAAIKGPAPAAAAEESAASRVSTRRKPDIYYLIADGYGASSTLAGVYGFSNRPFLEALKTRGFYVADDSRANYVTTVLSLTSSLSMDYIPASPPSARLRSPEAPDGGRVFPSLAVVRYLQRQGYQTINVRPNYRFGTADAPGALQPGWSLDWNSLSAGLLRSSVLTGFVALLVEGDVRRQHLGMVEALLATRRVPGPKFVFAHFLAPHPPFVFTATGEPNRQPSEGWADRDGYIHQVQFISTTMLAIIDSLSASAAERPIILLQGDHGPASEGWSWITPSPSFVRERVPILNAYRVPDRNCPFYHDVTPVNSFRILFNCLFDARMALRPDSSFFSSYKDQFAFQNVTGVFTEAPPTPPLPPHHESRR